MIPSTLVAILALLAGPRGSIESLRPAGAADWQVHLRDGTTVHSSRAPLVCFGAVRAWTLSGVRVIPVGRVDLEASKRQWADADAWHRLDTDPSQGRPVPAFDAVGTDGRSVRIATGDGRYTFLEVWAGY